MKKILIVIFVILAIFKEDNIFCMQDDSQLATEIKLAIENRDFQVVTLTRPDFNWHPFLLNEIQYVFQNIATMAGIPQITIDENFVDMGKFEEILFKLVTKYRQKINERKFLNRSSAKEIFKKICEKFPNIDGKSYSNCISQYVNETGFTLIEQLSSKLLEIKKKFDDINANNISKYITDFVDKQNSRYNLDKNMRQILLEICKKFPDIDNDNYLERVQQYIRKNIIKILLERISEIELEQKTISKDSILLFASSADFEHNIYEYYMDVLADISKENDGIITLEKIKTYLSKPPKQTVGQLPLVNKEKFTILVLQETFFSKTHALDNFTVEKIIKYCNKLTELCPTLIIVINLLHEFKKSDSMQYLSNYTVPNESFYNAQSKSPWTLKSFTDRAHLSYEVDSNDRLANYSLMIANGKPVAIYRKGFYAEENDYLIEKGYTYEFGNFLVASAIQNCNPIYDALFKPDGASLCRMFICADLNLAACEYDKIREKIGFNTKSLTIIQSNSFSLSSPQIFQAIKRDLDYTKIIPKKTLIIHSDPRFGSSFGYIASSWVPILKCPPVFKKYYYAFCPINQELEVISDIIGVKKISQCVVNEDTYPLFKEGLRVHTGKSGACFLGEKSYIINMWSSGGVLYSVVLDNMLD